MRILMDMNNATEFAKGARVGLAGVDLPATGMIVGPYFTHRADVVMVHWDGHEEGRNLVMNTGNLRLLAAEAA